MDSMLGAATGADPVVVVSDANARDWDAFVHSQAAATGYHLWRWREVMERGLGHSCRYFAAIQNERIVGVLPTALLKRPFMGGVLSSLPYVNYGGVLAATPAAAAALIDQAGAVVAKERLAYLLLRHRRRCFSHLPVRSHKQTQLMSLVETPEAMWQALPRKVRNHIRKAEKSGLTVVSGGEEFVDDFYAVFARNMRDLGTPVYGRQLFVEMLRAFPSDIRVHAVRLKDMPIAAALSYRFRDVVEVPSASSLREHRILCANYLVYWHVVQTAIAQGARTLDFGRSTPGDGTYQFKEQWGAVPEQLEWEYVLGAGQALPSSDRHDSKFNVAIAAWKRLPLSVAAVIGPRLARAVP